MNSDVEYLRKKVELLEKMVANLDRRLHICSEIIKRLDEIEDLDSDRIDILFDIIKKMQGDETERTCRTCSHLPEFEICESCIEHDHWKKKEETK